MRKAEIYFKDILAGFLTEESPDKYIFRYEDNYFVNSNLPAISLTMPKTRQEYQSEYLFPVFFNMLSEGANKELQTRRLQIDENDSFALLLATADYDTIGAITVKSLNI